MLFFRFRRFETGVIGHTPPKIPRHNIEVLLPLTQHLREALEKANAERQNPMLPSVIISGVVFLCGCARLAEPEAASHCLRTLFRTFAQRPRAEKHFILEFIVMMVAHGGLKSTNSVPQGRGEGAAIVTTTGGAVTNGAIAGGGVIGDFEEIGTGGFGMLTGLESELPRLTTNQYLAGFALVSVSTNTAPWVTVPSKAVAHAPWTRYGLAEDTIWLPTNGWAFILSTNPVDGVHISSSGTLSFGLPKGFPARRRCWTARGSISSRRCTARSVSCRRRAGSGTRSRPPTACS